MNNLNHITHSTLFQLGCLIKTLHSQANQMLKQDGFNLKIEQLPVLMAIHYQGVLCQQEIADLLDRDKSSVQRTITSLCRYAFIQIRTDQRDHRRNLVSMTPTGKLLAEKLHRELIRLECLLFFHLKETDKTTLTRLIRKTEQSIAKFNKGKHALPEPESNFHHEQKA